MTAKPISEWHEDDGAVLWWRFPVEEPPYVGDPRWEDWPGYHTHWTPIEVPAAPPKVEIFDDTECLCYEADLGHHDRCPAKGA